MGINGSDFSQRKATRGQALSGQGTCFYEGDETAGISWMDIGAEEGVSSGSGHSMAGMALFGGC